MATTDKGTQLMEGLLLNQYTNSPYVQEYISAYVSEMDILFEKIEEVYLGRFIENAVGTQLDIIGTILDEDRNVPLPTQFFGFEDEFGGPTTNVEKLADEAVPAFGGVFKSEGQAGSSNFALSDGAYRRLLLAKAILVSSPVCSFDTCYQVVSTLLGKTPQTMTLNVVGPRSLEMILSSGDTSIADDSLVTYFGQYLFPLGTGFAVTRI